MAGHEEQRAALAETLRARGLSDALVARVLRHTVHGIALHDISRTIPPALPAGATVVGGPSQGVPGGAWPTNARSGLPLSFIARIDLAAAGAFQPMPRSGDLLVYADMSEDVNGDQFDAQIDPLASVHVAWVAPGMEILQVEPPQGAQEFAAVPLAASTMPLIGELDDIADGLDEDDQDRVLAVVDTLPEGEPVHQLLGASRDLQGQVLEEIDYHFEHTISADGRARYSPSERASEGWILLAQLLSCDDDHVIGERAPLMIQDAGNLSLVLPRADLEAARFDRVLGIVQSY